MQYIIFIYTMRLFNMILLTFLFLGTISCKDDAKSEKIIQQESIPVEIKSQRKADEPVKNIEKEADSINNKNTVAFLTKYGALHQENKIRIKTRLGNITLKLYDETPLHRASFIFLTKVGYFNTTCFYRVVPNFIIQGGESERLDTQNFKAKYRRYKLPKEFNKNLKHKYGALASARDWVNNPHKKSTPFEFYIVQNRKGAFHLDGEHTVFGEVVSGFDVIDKIVNLKTGSDEWPLEDVFMKVEVIN